MNNIISNWENIKKMALNIGMPEGKNRALIREFLQAKFIYELYSQKDSRKLSFIGGTSLRLLRNLPRFSEDLDFDNLGLTDNQIEQLVLNVGNAFNKENILCDLSVKKNEGKFYFEIKFPDLLEPLAISHNPKEKLMIKVDYSRFWKSQNLEVNSLLRFGFSKAVLTNSLNNFLVQKLTAYVKRKETQPRDIFDIVWLYANGARYDFEFAKNNNLENLLDEAREKLSKEGIKENIKIKLSPFLLKTQDIDSLLLFKDVLQKL